MFRSVFVFLLAITLFSCHKNPSPSDLVTLQIADSYADCVGVGPRKCLQVKEPGAANWRLFYDPIEGFTYEEGYTYEVRVKREPVKNPPADRSSIRYVLVKLVSKQKA